MREGGSTANTGLCWDEAYGSLEDALNDLNEIGSEVMEIRIAEGTYNAPGVNTPFLIEAPCTISGGYRGFTDEFGDADDRDLVNYRTILSGDLGENGNAKQIVFVVVDIFGQEPFGDLTFDGLEFTEGLQEEGTLRGAAICSDNTAEPAGFFGTLTISRCIFTDNHARDEGGAVFLRYWNVEIRHSRFEGNTAHGGGFGIGSGGAVCVRSSALTIANCDFVANEANGQGSVGGAVAIIKTPEAVIGNVVFLGNLAHGTASGQGPGGVGGALAFDGVSADPSLLAMNCVFQSNWAGGSGGGVYSPNPIEIHSSTFEGNSANGFGGGLFTGDDVSTTLINTIFWANSCAGAGAEPVESQIAPLDELEADFVITHCCIEDLDTGSFDDGNRNDNPRFVDAGGGNLRLSHCSLLIDQGDEELLPDDLADVDDDPATNGELPVDLVQTTRVLGDEVDMGAYEFVEPECPGDFNEDGQVDGDDMGTLLGYWGSAGAFSVADFNCDGEVNGDDIGTLLGFWGECNAFQMSGGGGPITPQAAAEEFGFETIEEFAEWLSSLDFNTMCALLEGLFGD